MTLINLFSYGTLQYESVQFSTFGRLLTGTHDILLGYKLSTIEIIDPDVIALSGESVHKILHYTNNPDDHVEGMVFEITPEELQQSDRYEVDSYKRVLIMLQSGQDAWVYIDKNDKSY